MTSPEQTSPTSGPAQGASPPPEQGGSTKPAGPAAAGSGPATPKADGEQAAQSSKDPAQDGAEDEGGAAGTADEPGGASSRDEHVKAAQGIFAGDAVRDKYVFYQIGGGNVVAPLSRLSDRLEAFALNAFVAPTGWDKTRSDFRDRRTVILRGEPGHGRHTMATRLLLSAGATVIYQLDHQVDVARMAERIRSQQIDTGTAFLLCQPKDPSGLDSLVLQGLEYELTRADARLVVTVGKEARLTEKDLLAYVMDLPPGPDLSVVLERHLDYHLDEERAHRILADKAVEQLVAAELAAIGATCENAAFIASVLSRVTEPIDLEKIRSQLRQRGSDEFDIWFDSLADLEIRCFAIALAVLNGLPFEDVADAAQRLHARLSGDGTVTLGDELRLQVARRDPFTLGSWRLAQALQARLSGGGPHDDATTTPMTVAYQDPEYPRQVIKRAWKGHLIHDQLLEWLTELVMTGSDQARVFAGSTVGLLATYSFDKVNRKVLQSWAGSKPSRLREGVADAVRVAAKAPESRPKVHAAVQRWYLNRSAPLAQSTAAIAHGAGIGFDDPSVSFDALWRLAVVDDVEVHRMIGQGLTWLLVDKLFEYAPMVYDVVDRCLADPKRSLAGCRAFLIVANGLVTNEKGADDTVVATWPSLLYLAVNDVNLRDPLFRWWGRVLPDPRVRDLAHHVMRNWAVLGENNAAVHDAFVRMVRGVHRTSGHAGATFSHLARQWSSADELLPLPKIARSVANVLAS